MKKSTLNIIIFSIGILTGVLLTVGFGFCLIRKDTGKPLVGPKTFGDMTVYRIRSTEKDRMDPGVYESMVLARNGQKLVQINQSEAGISGQLLMYGDSVPIAKVMFAGEGLQNPIFAYGRFPEEPSYPIQKFVDLDLNGQLDFMMNLDKDGKATYSKIFLPDSQTWEVPGSIDLDHDRAVINDTEYEFVPHQGWQKVTK